jgi:hypothetical protein
MRFFIRILNLCLDYPEITPTHGSKQITSTGSFASRKYFMIFSSYNTSKQNKSLSLRISAVDSSLS